MIKKDGTDTSIRKNKVAPEKWAEYLAKRRAYMKRYFVEHGDKLRRYHRIHKKRYRARRLAALAGRPNPGHCEVCQVAHRRMVFDHCHVTERFRGWLCAECNSILGISHDDAKRLRLLAEYLEQN